MQGFHPEMATMLAVSEDEVNLEIKRLREMRI